MTEQTLGGTLYEAWIAKEGRQRLNFEPDRQPKAVTKAVTNVAEPRELCANEHSAAFADDTTPQETIDAWLTYAPAQSDANSLKDLRGNSRRSGPKNGDARTRTAMN
jgi:hypothetical protein